MKLVLLKGLPASGKSTEAKRLVDSGQYVRVNRDTIREMLLCPRDDGQKAFNGKVEKIVTKISQDSVRSIMESGKFHIVVDECNLNVKYMDKWAKIANEYNYTVDVRGMGVSIEECIRRDANRTPNVGERVIKQMAIRNGLLKGYDVAPKAPFKIGNSIVLCDVDGTLSDLTHRRHWVNTDDEKNAERGCGKARKNWKKFFETMSEDTLRQSTYDILQKYVDDGYTIVLVTARPDDYLVDTVDWMTKYNVHYDFMLMRKAGDYRRDDIFKQEILDTWFPNKDLIEVVIDDRPQVIRMWRENGLKVIDVGNGKEF